MDLKRDDRAHRQKPGGQSSQGSALQGDNVRRRTAERREVPWSVRLAAGEQREADLQHQRNQQRHEARDRQRGVHRNAEWATILVGKARLRSRCTNMGRILRQPVAVNVRCLRNSRSTHQQHTEKYRETQP